MNKNIGDFYEKKLICLLAEHGWWCHLFAYKLEGQPCDVIALKNNIPFLLDVKHCDEERFAFRNIRTNQKNCFELARKRGNRNLGFAIYYENGKTWKWLSYDYFVLLDKRGEKSAKLEELPELI